MTSACLVDMMVDEKIDRENLHFNKKRTKLCNPLFDTRENSQLNFSLKNEGDLKKIYPFLNQPEVDEILQKTSYNIDTAVKMIHSLNNENFSKNEEFVNLHQNNKKRRFTNIDQASSIQFSEGRVQKHSQIFMSDIGMNPSSLSSTNTMSMIQEKPKVFNPEAESEKIILFAKQSSVPDLKAFIKSKILSYLSAEDKQKINEVKRKLEYYISQNIVLKTTMLTLYEKYKEKEKYKKEEDELLQEVESLRGEIEFQKMKYQRLHDTLLRSEQANILNFEDPRDVC